MQFAPCADPLKGVALAPAADASKARVRKAPKCPLLYNLESQASMLPLPLTSIAPRASKAFDFDRRSRLVDGSSGLPRTTQK
jgi:hypothetical protein